MEGGVAMQKWNYSYIVASANYYLLLLWLRYIHVNRTEVVKQLAYLQ